MIRTSDNRARKHRYGGESYEGSSNRRLGDRWHTAGLQHAERAGDWSGRGDATGRRPAVCRWAVAVRAAVRARPDRHISQVAQAGAGVIGWDGLTLLLRTVGISC